jgi:hypothetical protein
MVAGSPARVVRSGIRTGEYGVLLDAGADGPAQEVGAKGRIEPTGQSFKSRAPRLAPRAADVRRPPDTRAHAFSSVYVPISELACQTPARPSVPSTSFCLDSPTIMLLQVAATVRCGRRAIRTTDPTSTPAPRGELRGAFFATLSF